MPKTTRKNEAVWVESRKRWQINVQLNGKRKTFASTREGRKGKIEAERKADEWLESGASDNPRFGESWEKFLQRTKAVTGTANYLKHESIGRNWLLPRLEHKRLSAITLRDLQNCVDDAYVKGLAKKSLTNIRASLSALASFIKADNIYMTSPANIIIPKNAKVGERNILQPNDLKVLFTISTYEHYGRIITSHYIHAWRFAVITGLRPGELYGLKKEDIQGDIVNVRRAHNRENEMTRGKNDNAQRWFYIPDPAKKILNDQASMLKEMGIISPWVFPNESGGITDQDHAYKRWLTYRKQHGIKLTPYEMRHTMVSVSAPYVPEKLLKPIVGHSDNMDTMGVYAHEIDGEARRAADLISEAFSKLLV